MEEHSELIGIALHFRLEYLKFIGTLDDKVYNQLMELLDSLDTRNIEIVHAQTLPMIIDELQSDIFDIELSCEYGGSGDSGEIYSTEIIYGSNYNQSRFDDFKKSCGDEFSFNNNDCELPRAWSESISEVYGEWGNNEGSGGSGVIDIFKLTISFNHDWYVITSENESTTIDLSTIKFEDI